MVQVKAAHEPSTALSLPRGGPPWPNAPTTAAARRQHFRRGRPGACVGAPPHALAFPPLPLPIFSSPPPPTPPLPLPPRISATVTSDGRGATAKTAGATAAATPPATATPAAATRQSRESQWLPSVVSRPLRDDGGGGESRHRQSRWRHASRPSGRRAGPARPPRRVPPTSLAAAAILDGWHIPPASRRGQNPTVSVAATTAGRPVATHW